jgi:phosphatidylglycerophosphate synthase
MPAVRTGTTVGLIAQIVLLAALAAIVGISVTGWLVGVGYGLVLWGALSRAMERSGAAALGPADRVTLTRATLVGAVTALSLSRHPAVPALVALSVVALVLDGVDGVVARRSGTASALGARFDMEVDAYLILVLSCDVARSLGAWVLAIGVMRYAFVAASWALPWMGRMLPPRYWRKVVAAVQGVALVVAAAGVLPYRWAVATVLAALALLVESFGRDVLWLWHRRIVPAEARPARDREDVLLR